MYRYTHFERSGGAIIKFLVQDCGAEYTVRNKEKLTPLDTAAQIGKKAYGRLRNIIFRVSSARQSKKYHVFLAHTWGEVQGSRARVKGNVRSTEGLESESVTGRIGHSNIVLVQYTKEYVGRVNSVSVNNAKKEILKAEEMGKVMIPVVLEEAMEESLRSGYGGLQQESLRGEKYHEFWDETRDDATQRSWLQPLFTR